MELRRRNLHAIPLIEGASTPEKMTRALIPGKKVAS